MRHATLNQGAGRPNRISLRAGAAIEPGERARLERPSRCMSRPPAVGERLSLTAAPGHVR